MNRFRSRFPLACALLACLFTAGATSYTQTPLHISGHVEDSAGNPVANAFVHAHGSAGEISTTSHSDGSFTLDYPAGSPVTVKATTHLMTSGPLSISPQTPSPITLTLHPTAVTEQITVTATRSSIDLPATANTIYALTASELADYPAQQLDDKLRQQAGFELFRRSSSRVQNPTSQGISLRGLGSTAASRTLVLQDSVPLNDPFGGWIHWNEIPSDALEAVTLATGGGSDLYGSSALGGVIDVIPARPTTGLFDLSALGAGQDTSSISGRADLGSSHTRQLLAADGYRTNGYIPTAPAFTGPVDRPANVHYQSARTETDRILSPGSRAFLIGNLFNEARNNGTAIQTNGTRLWRYIGGGDWTASPLATGRVRLFGSDEQYRQSFSSINTARTTESLSRLQHVGSQELGASTDATFALSPVSLVAGADVRDIRATDAETPISSNRSNGLADTSSRQRLVGGFAEALASHRQWSGSLSLRLDSVSNLDTRSLSAASATAPLVRTTIPERSEFIASPRLGIVRQLSSFGTLHASVFRAFRTPTMNELYRTGQVGQEITQANSQLQSERATGWEIGTTYSSPGNSLAASATYFWTQINRPVSAVLISTTPTTILEKRQNLGQIVSQGTELHLDIRPTHPISAALEYQYAHAVVTQFSAQPSLVGNWIPEVPRQSFTAQLRAQRARLGEITLAARASGRAYDDIANTFVLDRFFQLDLFARHSFGPHWTASLIFDNLTNQRPQVARTPILTLGSPFLAQGGLAFHWSHTDQH